VKYILCFISSIIFFTGCSSENVQTVNIEWDLKKDHSFNNLKWPDLPPEKPQADLRTIQCTVNFMLHLGKFDLQGVSNLVTVKSANGLISSINIHYDNETADNIYAHVKQLAKDASLPSDNLNSWYSATRSGQTQSVLVQDLNINPIISIEILQSFEPTKPWYISYTIDWENVGILNKH
jgi:hypothetical protein